MNTDIKTIVSVDNQEIVKKEVKPEVLAKANAIVKTLDQTKQNSIVNLGLETQQKIGNISGQLLKQVRAKDIGDVGDVVTSMLSKINYVNVDSFKPSPLASIPLIGPFLNKMFNKGKEIMAKYESVETNLNDSVLIMDKSRLVLNRDNTTMESMFVKNVEYIKDLDASILAGKMKIEELQLTVSKFSDNDELEDYEKKDTVSYLERLEKKVADLQGIRIDAIQTLPTIRTIQGANQVLEEKIISAINSVVPLWKKHIVIALAVNNQRKALEVQEAVSATTNLLILKNSEMMKENAVRIAEANEKTTINVETLKQVNTNLITMLDDILKIKEEGKTARMNAEIELGKVEEELKTKILSMKSGTTASEAKIIDVSDDTTEYESVN